ncbi:hypothetical protein L914_11093 [Phytophthora nicotianae]|uniref:Uncharacterized protein n=2 Tax=Phytophthora nicotianae TaxID=4792 RepID=V9EZH2_PHYNI|nr:hypothetical protein F443_11572 [Phytophthora nicotianae P1569]ETM43420.1 hypothetical protein L914_11093 [Phytophthora nicotianae]
MKGELDRAHQIQRMTSSHSFRLENDVVRLKQRLEQTTRRMQHIQRKLESAEAQLRIATTIHTQYNQSKRALIELNRKVRTTADWMLEKIRERQHSRCSNCMSEWAEMKRIARDLAAVESGPRTCCQRHTRQRSTRITGRAPLTLCSSQPRSAVSYLGQNQSYCDF